MEDPNYHFADMIDGETLSLASLFNAPKGGDMLVDEIADTSLLPEPENHGPLHQSWNHSARENYEENCPYRKSMKHLGVWGGDERFRLTEQFSDGLIYTGDSFGSHSYIDVDELRPCSPSCFCRGHDHIPNLVTFAVDKSPDRIDVTIHSEVLYSEIVQAIDLKDTPVEHVSQYGQPKLVDGLVLLKAYSILQTRLNILESEVSTSPETIFILRPLELLVHGFLDDGEVFKSFGHENLYEKGFLSFELWKIFQQDQLQKDISTLDDSFRAVDEIEEPKDFSKSEGQEEMMTLQSKDVEPNDAQMLEPSNNLDQGMPWDPIDFHNGDPWGNTRLVEPFISSKLQCFSFTFNRFVSCLSPEPLHTAISFNDISEVKLLLDGGVSVNGSFSWDSGGYSPIVQAAAAGNEVLVQLLFERGADYNDLALITAAKAGHEKVVRLLLEKGGASNSPGLQFFWCRTRFAVRGGNDFFDRSDAVVMWRWEDVDGIARDVVCNLSRAPLGCMRSWVPYPQNADLQERGPATGLALLLAAKAGHKDVVGILLDNGASMGAVPGRIRVNATWHIKWQSPVVEAEAAGQWAVRRLLVERGAFLSDVEAVISMHATNKKDLTYQYIREQFLRQNELLTKAALAVSAKLGEPGIRFRNHRETWAAGITTMRRLCNGRPPRGLANIMAFLCISKAMAEALDSSYTIQFFEDLERWQILLDSKTTIHAYQELIRLMWGVILPENISRSLKPSDLSTLTHFQALLSTLVRQASRAIESHGLCNQSLEDSQQRFRIRNGLSPAVLQPQPKVPSPDSSSENRSRSVESIDPEPPDIPITPKRMDLKEQIENDDSSASLSAKVVILMAGQIFAIVIIFLHWLRNIYSCFNCSPTVVGWSNPPGIQDLEARCQVLTTYLNLAVHFAVPLAGSMARYIDMVGEPSGVGPYRDDDNSNRIEVTTSPFLTSGQIDHFNAVQSSSSSSDESGFLAKGQLSSLGPRTFSSSPNLEQTPSTDVSFLDTPSTLATTQISTPAELKPPQKPKAQCPTCKKKVLVTNLKRHIKDHTGENKVKCRLCGKLLGRKEYLRRHERERCRARGFAGDN